MKSKYIKIFMIFALVFAMFAAFFTAPFVVSANNETTEETVSEEVQHDLDAIKASLPSSANISFPVTWQSVYGNEITWSSNNDNIIKYDEEAHWMVVYREKVTGEPVTVRLTYTVAGVEGYIDYTITKGTTYVPTYSITYKAEVSAEAPKEFKLGQETFVLPTLTDENRTFEGWVDQSNPNEVITKVLVGTMKDLVLSPKWKAQSTITFDTDKSQLIIKPCL